MVPPGSSYAKVQRLKFEHRGVGLRSVSHLFDFDAGSSSMEDFQFLSSLLLLFDYDDYDLTGRGENERRVAIKPS